MSQPDFFSFRQLFPASPSAPKRDWKAAIRSKCLDFYAGEPVEAFFTRRAKGHRVRRCSTGIRDPQVPTYT